MKPVRKNKSLAGIFLLLFLFENTRTARSMEMPYRNEATRQMVGDALDDKDRVQRIRAARALQQSGETRDMETAARATKDPVEAVRQETLPSPTLESAPSSFHSRPEIMTDLVTDAHRDPRIRQKARLEKLEKDPAFKEDFSKLLEDPDHFVRRAVSSEIVRLRGQSSLAIWKLLLGSSQTDVRTEAAWAAGQLGCKDVEMAVITLLESESERSRLAAIESLATIGGDATHQALGPAIAKYNGRTQEALLRLAAKLQAKPSYPEIRKVFENATNPMEIRLLAADVLRDVADAEARPLLMRIITNFDPSAGKLREHVAGALGVVGGPEAVPPLKRLITERVLKIKALGEIYDSETTRMACVMALEKLKALEILQSLKSHPSLLGSTEKLRQTLAETLTRMTGTLHDYQRHVVYRELFMESLMPEEYPPALAENLKMPPVFVSTGNGFKQ